MDNPNAIIKLAQRDPARMPSWRWDLVVSLASRQTNPDEIKDRWIRDGLKLWRKRNRPEEIVNTKLEPIWMAHRIYLWNNPARWLLEARILAGEDIETIAQKAGTSPKVVEAYSKLFFDVEDRIESTDYILSYAIGPITTAMSGSNMEGIWKLYAYFGGPVMLETLAFRFPEGRVRQVNDLRNVARKLIETSVEVQALLASRLARVTNRQFMPAINAYLKLTSTEEGRSGTAKVLDSIGEVIESIELKVKKLPDQSSNEPSLDDLKN